MKNPLVDALTGLFLVLPNIRFPVPLDGSDALSARARSVTRQVEDYLLPRARRLDAPLLAVVGGSTGAGKSTIVNSLLGQTVTQAGVRRPTTTAPTLICNQADRGWFRSGAVLPELVRTDHEAEGSRALRIVTTDLLPAGLALLDAPDIDSIDDDNRLLSRQLLAAADLWLFVTTATRYADAVAWELLDAAAARDAVVALVLNRCPPAAEPDLRTHLRQLLSARGIQPHGLFSVAEQDEQGEKNAGVLRSELVSDLRVWLGRLAVSRQERHAVAVQTLAGTVRGLDAELNCLVDGTRKQLAAVTQLRDFAEVEFRLSMEEISRAIADGSMLRGEVLSRWQDMVGTGDLMRSIEERIAAARDRLTEWFTGRKRVEPVEVAISEGLVALIVEHGTAACQRAAGRWSLTPWGQALVKGDRDPLGRPDPSFAVEAERLVQAWQGDIFTLVEQEGRHRRRAARFLALGTNAIGVSLVITVFATTGGLTTAEVGIAGGSSVLAQRFLEGIFGDDAVRRLAARARAELEKRISALLASQFARFDARLDQLGVEASLPERLLQAAGELRSASTQAFEALTRPEGY